MNQFCKDVIDFLMSEYGDAYEYHIEKHITLPPYLDPNGFSTKVELWVKFNPCYTLKIVNENMQYLFSLYNAGEYIQERKQWQWQKELIDMIEGS